jgi:PAS domain S-box-containing protein
MGAVMDYAVFMLDTAGRVTTWDDRAGRVYGYRPAEVVGRDFSLFHAAADAPRRMLRRALEEGRCGEEVRFLGKDGTGSPAEMEVTAQFDRLDNHVGFVVVVQGIRERRRGESGSPGATAVVGDAERHRVERRLHSERRFSRTMIESMPGILYFYDSSGRFLRWNRNFETVSGYSGEEIARMHPLDFFAERDQPLLERRIAEVFARGESSVEAEFVTKSGIATPYFFTGRRVEFEGEPCLVGMGIDISERRSAEDRLAESERKYRELVEHANSIILRWNSDGIVTLLNEFGQRFFGYSAAEIIGSHVIGTIVPLTESGGRDLRGLMEEICADPRAFEQNVNENMRRNGERVWIAWTNRVVLDGQGRVAEILSIGTDITERRRAEQARRESEQRFRELAEAIQEVFWMTDPVGKRLLYVSPAYEKIWGRSCAGLDDAARTWPEGVHPDDRERVLRATEGGQASGGYDETYRILRPDGAVRWIRDRAFPVRGAAGEIVHVVGTAEDITARRQLEEQFRQAQKMEAIGQLAGGVAHDFNNILAAILGNTQLALADTATGHPARESLEEIRKASLRASNLVQQILAFSRHQPLQRRVVELGPTLQEAYNFLRATLPSVVELTLSIDAAAPPVLADQTQIYQVIANLCTNAWHALEDRPGRVAIALEAVDLDAAGVAGMAGLRPGRFARLAVADDGKGMDAATLRRIFDPFFTTKEAGRGTGLGLSVVHGIVQAHDGAITVASRPGEGTTFQVHLPAAAAAVDAVPAPAPQGPGRGGGQSILYLDDEGPLVFLATRMLERLGYRISGYTRADEALQAFRADPGRFDLVITDLNMPGVSGMQIAAEILALRPGLPVVLCSGYVTDELRQRARDAGICEVLYKPATMEEFSQAIHRLAVDTRAPDGSGKRDGAG